MRIHAHGPAQAGITLHSKHDQPAGAFTTGGAAGQGYTLYLRPEDGTQQAVDALQALITLGGWVGGGGGGKGLVAHAPARHCPRRAVNNRGIPAAPSAAAAAAASPTPAESRYEMASTPGGERLAGGGGGGQGRGERARAHVPPPLAPHPHMHTRVPPQLGTLRPSPRAWSSSCTSMTQTRPWLGACRSSLTQRWRPS